MDRLRERSRSSVSTFRAVSSVVVLGLTACGEPRSAVTQDATPGASQSAASAKPSKAEKAERRAAKKAEREAKNRDAKKSGDAKKNVDAKAPDVAPSAKSSTPRGPVVVGGKTLVCPSDNALTYRSFGAGFLRTWCTGCHSSTLAADDRQDAPDGVDFDLAASLAEHAPSIYDRAVVEGRKLETDPASASPMPPAGVVPAAELRRLEQWIACGTPGT